MKTRVVSYVVTLCLALSMMASAAITGIAQGRSDPRDDLLSEIVICDAQGGTSVITIDADGNRVDPDDHCADLPCRDCLSAVSAATAPMPSRMAALRTAHQVHPVLRHHRIPAQPSVYKPARAPPTEV